MRCNSDIDQALHRSAQDCQFAQFNFVLADAETAFLAPLPMSSARQTSYMHISEQALTQPDPSESCTE